MKNPLLNTRFLFLSVFMSGLLFLLAFFVLGANNSSLNELEALPFNERLSLVQENSLISSSDPSQPEPKVSGTMPVIITAYSSTPEQTDDTPFITALGTHVRDGIVANNYLSFGTKIRIPELYGDKIFVVEDRMSWRKGNNHIDIWFSSCEGAKEFGVKRTYIEIIES